MPPSTRAQAEEAIQRLLRRQHGVISWHQLVQSGLAPSTATSRIRRGSLIRVHPKVYTTGHAELSREGQLRAALLAVGGDCVLGGSTALEVHRLSPARPAAPIVVVVPRRVQPIPGVRVRQTRQLQRRDVRRVQRLPVTSMARTLADLATELDALQLANVMHEAAWRGLLDLADLRRLMVRVRTSNGYPVLVQAVELHLAGSVGTRSSLERRFLGLVASAAIPMPLVNTPVSPDDGPPIEVDACWRASRLCVEIDGPGHERRRTRRDDEARDARLRAAGYRVLRVTWRELDGAPRDVRDRVAAAVREGMRRST